MADADVTLVVVDGPLTNEDHALMSRVSGRHILVGNKCDLGRHAPGLPVSALTGQGIEELRRAIVPEAGLASEEGFITSIRHERLLRESFGHLGTRVLDN